MEGAARFTLCSRPDRDREQHDVHGAEAGNRQRPDQPVALGVFLVLLALEEMAGIA